MATNSDKQPRKRAVKPDFFDQGEGRPRPASLRSPPARNPKINGSVQSGRPQRTVTKSDVTESDIGQVTQGEYGPVETQVRIDVRELGELSGIRRSQAQIAYALARNLDSPEASSPASIARELTARLADLEATATGREVSRADALVAEVADELAPRRRAVPQAGA